MKLKHLIENILSKDELSRLEVNRIAYLACYYYKKETNKQLIKNEWIVDKYGPYLHEVGEILNQHRKITKIQHTNCYGREIDKFKLTKIIKNKTDSNEMLAIENAIDSFKNLSFIEFNQLLSNC